MTRLYILEYPVYKFKYNVIFKPLVVYKNVNNYLLDSMFVRISCIYR